MVLSLFIGVSLGIALGAALASAVGFAAKPDISSIVIAVGFRPRKSMASELVGRGYEVYEVGDGRQVGNILTSIWDAYEVAHTL